MNMAGCNDYFLETVRSIFAAVRATHTTANTLSQEIAESVKLEALTFSANLIFLA
jgi:hypothetical protein